ncbi:MAG: hypothetical protein U0359_14495 [Byssovorax sp.]
MQLRRLAIGLAPLTLTAACILGPTSSSSGGTGSGTTSSTASSSSGGDTPCDGKGACNTCVDCAGQVQCASQVQACNNNSFCIGLAQCLEVCGTDQTCQQQCYQGNADGVSTYNAMIKCLYCDQCPKDCSGYVNCPG